MVGLMQIMIYMLAVYLVFKGVEIFQIALVSTATRGVRYVGITLGGIFLFIALAAGVGFSYWADVTAQSISDRMNTIPRP